MPNPYFALANMVAAANYLPYDGAVREFMKCEGVGEATAKSIVERFTDLGFLAQMSSLIFEYGITFEA